MKHRIVSLVLFILITYTFFQSCQKSSAIDEKKFVKIYADMILIEDTSSLSQPIIKEKVLKKFSVSENDYDNTIKIYNSDPEKWQAFFDSVIVYIERIKPKPKKVDAKSLPERSVSVDKKNL
jgi:hypothetical protein